MANAEETLVALKAECEDKCGAARAIPDADRVEGVDHEAAAHAEHAEKLEAAYLAFQGREDETSESNPAEPGETQVTADVVVQAEVPPQ